MNNISDLVLCRETKNIHSNKTRTDIQQKVFWWHYLLFRYLFISGYIVTSNHLLHNFSRILWELCRDNQNQIPNKYSLLSLNRHLYKTNTSEKPTPTVGPFLSLPLFLTLYKMDISLRWTFTTGSKGVHLRESWLYSQTLLIRSLRGP